MNLNTLNLKRMFALASAALMLAILNGCEDVIQVNLDNIEPRLVIEGYVLWEFPPVAAVIITKTNDFYRLSTFTMVTGATAIISDDEGNVVILEEYEEGVYLSPFIHPMVGRTYTATVTVDGVTYTATATLPYPIYIDSLVAEYQPGGGFGYDADEGYRLHVFFNDWALSDDYCNMKVHVNDSVLTSYYLYDDQFSDGNTINYEYFGDVFNLGDTLYVEIYTMDSTVYDYFSTLQNCIAYSGEDNIDGIPANPISNWDNDALGYFGAFCVTSDQIIVRDPDSLYIDPLYTRDHHPGNADLNPDTRKTVRAIQKTVDFENFSIFRKKRVD